MFIERTNGVGERSNLDGYLIQEKHAMTGLAVIDTSVDGPHVPDRSTDPLLVYLQPAWLPVCSQSA